MENLKEYFEGHMKDSITGELYHGSPKRMDVILPHTASHGRPYVYASPDYLFSLCYAGLQWNDFEINQSYYNGELYLTEIQRGQFREKLQRPGYVYHLNKDDFKKLPNSAESEFVSEQAVTPLAVDEIPNVYRRLVSKGVHLYEYPNLPPFIDDREGYIISKAKDLYVQDNPEMYQYLVKTFPGTVSTALKQYMDEYKNESVSDSDTLSTYTENEEETVKEEAPISETADTPSEKEVKIPKVYFTKEITPESLIRLYYKIAAGKNLSGNVMVKISTGEPGGHNFLQPSLIGPLVNTIHGTICDANTAYGGKRSTTESHYQVMKDHGFTDIAPVDVLDGDGEIEIPVNNGYHLKTLPVGSHNSNYGTFLILTHFKGHAMAGFGGAMKNIAIGMASAHGKAIVHSAGKSETEVMGHPQQPFLQSMVDSVKASIDYGGRENFLYINVANNLSVDCDCDAHPADPTMKDIGVFASTDPLAIDQACIDAVDRAADNKDLVARIKRQTGRNILKYAEDAGIGSRKYELVDLDKENTVTESFSECHTLNDAIDNVISRNSIVNVWEPGTTDDGVSCNLKIYSGMVHAIPDEIKNREILRIKDIVPDTGEDGSAINILVADSRNPVRNMNSLLDSMFKEYSYPPHREEPMDTTPEQTVPSEHSFLRDEEDEEKPKPGFSSSIKTEGVVISKDDTVIGLDRWKPEKGKNILFITGLSGSGKSTLAEEYETKYHAHMFELDGLGHRYDSSGTAKVLQKVREKCPEYDEYFKDRSQKATDNIDVLWKASDAALDVMKEDYKTLYIVEGIQLYDGLYSDEVLKGKPLIIKNTSHLTSIIRALKRTSETDDKSFAKAIKENLPEILSYHRKSYKPFKKFKEKFAKESVSELNDLFNEAIRSFSITQESSDSPIMQINPDDLRNQFSAESVEADKEDNKDEVDEAAGVMEFLPYVGVKKDPPPNTDYPGSPFKALEESYETIFEFKNEEAGECVSVMETPFAPESVFLKVDKYHYPDIIHELVEDVITDIENGNEDYAEKANLVWHITGEDAEPLCAVAEDVGFVPIPSIDPTRNDIFTYAMDIHEFTPEKTQYATEAVDVTTIFRADEDYIYLNVPYCEFYIPTEYFAMGKKFAEDFTDKIHTIGLFNIGIFEDDKLVDVKVFNVPIYLDIMVYDYDVRMIDVGSGTPVECRVYKYYQDSIICRSFIAENSGVAQTFLQLIISGSMPGTIPYSQCLSVWRKNLELSGVNLGVSSAIMEMILAVMYRDAKDPSKKYCIRYGSSEDSSEFDYMSASIRQICQYNSTFTGIIYEDIDSMITSAINRNRNGKEEGETPMEKIIKM